MMSRRFLALAFALALPLAACDAVDYGSDAEPYGSSPTPSTEAPPSDPPPSDPPDDNGSGGYLTGGPSDLS
ncbi:MAG: hypothetical protein AAGK21_00420 [Bacteroidota bacterium]